MQIFAHLLLLVGIVTIAEFKLVNTNNKAEPNMINTNQKAELSLINTNKKDKFNLVNTNPTASESLTSKCNLKLVKIDLTNTEARQILCQLLRNMKVPQKGSKVVIKKPLKKYISLEFWKDKTENQDQR